MTEIAAFDFIENFFEVGDFVNNLLGLTVTDPVSGSFEASGLESLYFINNLSTFYGIILIYILMILVWMILYLIGKCKYSKKIKRVDNKLQSILFWNGLLVTVKESFMIVIFCAFITFKYSFDFQSFGMKFQNISMLLSLTFYIVVPVVVLGGVIW